MKLSNVKIGSIVNNHKIINIYKKPTTCYDKKYSVQREYKQTNITVQCEKCGYTKDVLPYGLNTLGCQQTVFCSKRFTDLTGKVFGDLKVIGLDKTRTNRKKHRIYWKCKCSCGTTQSILTFPLTHGRLTCAKCSRKKVGLQMQLPDHRAALNRGITNLRSSAKRKGRVVDLSDDEIIELFKGNCYYCNTPYEEYDDGSFSRNGIDRIDNTKGYTHTNSVTCCETCNRMKLMLSETAFVEHIEKIYKFIKERPTTIPKGSTPK